MATRTWTDPAIHANYHTLRQAILARGIDHDLADRVDRYWRSIGKLAVAGRL